MTDAAESARFLAYSVETQFNWRSVLLTGDASAVPEEKWSDVEPLTQNAWRPNTLQAASTTGGVAVYEFRVRERDGIQQNGLAPEFRETSSRRRAARTDGCPVGIRGTSGRWRTWPNPFGTRLITPGNR